MLGRNIVYGMKEIVEFVSDGSLDSSHGLESVRTKCRSGLECGANPNLLQELEFFDKIDIYKSALTKEVIKKVPGRGSCSLSERLGRDILSASQARKVWKAVKEQYCESISTRQTEYAQALPHGMKNIERIADLSTPATTEDILFARQRTSGVSRSSFTVRLGSDASREFLADHCPHPDWWEPLGSCRCWRTGG